jgi:hypothetical protein
MDFREIGWGLWSGFTWLRIGAVCLLLWMRWWTFGFWHQGVSLVSWTIQTCICMPQTFLLSPQYRIHSTAYAQQKTAVLPTAEFSVVLCSPLNCAEYLNVVSNSGTNHNPKA